ncbi:DUF7858 family protein [Halorientalis regularis]|uniref:Uncharacterized protein n=1 Tax=Halorientalis regularis TaxID=660518 RepID=A0A1G7GVU3_9EURY|nr:hypothetical protein [Halorientalis regularis]SDE92267.1 hypothetical protein SAMN05216218_102207 [Halorientalis regularis]
MGLSDIAAGVEVTTEQRDRGVATVDETDADLAERLADHADELPCAPAVAATVVEVYAEGRAIDTAASVAEVAPTTAAKTLHLCGEQVSPLGPTGRGIVRDWLDAKLSRTEAMELTGASERAFALAAYVETHEPIPAAREAVTATLSRGLGGEEPLDEAMSNVTDLRASETSGRQ